MSMQNSNHFTAKWIPPILTYCVASISMTLTNKLVLSGFHFKLPFLILGVQSVSSVLLLLLFTALGLTSHRGLNRQDVKRWFPVSLLMAAMLYTGSKALQYLSVPIVTIIKNLSIVLIAYGETKVFGGHVTHLMLLSFTLMVLSSMIAAQADLSQQVSSEQYSETVRGYFWLISNCIVSSSFVIFMRYTIRKSGPNTQPFKDFDTVFYNNFLSSPIFILLSLMGTDGSLTGFFEFYADPDNSHERQMFIMAMTLSGFFAFFISFASAWCMRVTNSTTYSMVGALNKLPIAISGMIVFNDPVTIYSVGSIFMGFFSGVLYTVAKLRYDEQQRNYKILPISTQSELMRQVPTNISGLSTIIGEEKVDIDSNDHRD